jgi:hypothetical protein
MVRPVQKYLSCADKYCAEARKLKSAATKSRNPQTRKSLLLIAATYEKLGSDFRSLAGKGNKKSR